MNLRPLLAVSATLTAAMAAASAWAWTTIPDGASLPVHWNLEGVADRFGSKAEALLVMPFVAVVVTVAFCATPYLDPRRANIEASGKFWNAVGIGVIVLLTYMHALVILSATGHITMSAGYVIPAVGLLMIVVGNYLSKTRSNWFGGVRTPWTLSSEYSWEKTHRWAGRLFVVSGVATIAAWLVAGAVASTVTLIVSLTAASLISIVLSYVFWRNDPARMNGA